MRADARAHPSAHRRRATPQASWAVATRDFHLHFVTTVQSYIIDQRVRTARELVDDLRVNLGAVPAALGLVMDGKRFARWFHWWTGQTPSQRREELAEEPSLGLWMRASVGALRPEEAEELARLCARAASLPPPSFGEQHEQR